MGSTSGTDIEPDAQTSLLDATLNLKGVLMAAVPGGIFFNVSWWL